MLNASHEQSPRKIIQLAPIEPCALLKPKLRRKLSPKAKLDQLEHLTKQTICMPQTVRRIRNVTQLTPLKRRQSQLTSGLRLSPSN